MGKLKITEEQYKKLKNNLIERLASMQGYKWMEFQDRQQRQQFKNT